MRIKTVKSEREGIESEIIASQELHKTKVDIVSRRHKKMRSKMVNLGRERRERETASQPRT